MILIDVAIFFVFQALHSILIYLFIYLKTPQSSKVTVRFAKTSLRFREYKRY